VGSVDTLGRPLMRERANTPGGTPTQNVEPEFVGAKAWLYKQHRRIILPLLQPPVFSEAGVAANSEMNRESRR